MLITNKSSTKREIKFHLVMQLGQGNVPQSAFAFVFTFIYSFLKFPLPLQSSLLKHHNVSSRASHGNHPS